MTAFDWHFNLGWAGGVWGDVVGSLLWAALGFAAAAIFWPRLRRAIERLFHRVFGSHPIHDEIAELRRGVEHIIRHDPDIPELPPKEAP